ncbi:MAG: EamA family transporter [Rhizobiales bacterium]|nr:EamA family transporter [Hyphomicrobiales bacterium]
MSIKDSLLAIVIMFVWGINFSVIKIGLESLDSFTLNSLRFALCALPMVFFVKRPNLSWVFIAIFGLLFGVGVWGMIGLGIHLGASAGIAALVLQLSSFFVMFLGFTILKEKINLGQIIGAIFALIGFLLIASVNDGSASFIGIVLVTIAACCLSTTIMMLKKVKIDDVLGLLVWSSLFSPIPLILIIFRVQFPAPWGVECSHEQIYS